MIFNYILISLHKKNKFTLYFLCYLLLCVLYYSTCALYYSIINLTDILYHIPFFYLPYFLTFYFFVNIEVGLKFRKLSFIGCYS